MEPWFLAKTVFRMLPFHYVWGVLFILTTHLAHRTATQRTFSKRDVLEYREKVRNMFQHAYNGYLRYAYPYDELRPLTCDGHDTWGSYSLTLIDALDTLAIMGNYSEFRRVSEVLLNTMDFDKDINVSVFETNIRVVGGLLSAHLLSHRADMVLEPGWPCSGPLLRMAETVARKLLPAFQTPTGMPYGTVNMLHGVPQGETSVTCTAGVGTFLVEFGALTRLTGDPVFEDTALRAMAALGEARSEIGLVGNHIDVASGKWTALDAGIGAGVDSYFEYLVKGSILFQIPELMTTFNEYLESIEKYLHRDDWFMWVNMKKGTVTLPVFQSLEAFWPGILSLVGDVDQGMKTIHNYHQVWRQFGSTPEFYNIPKAEVHPNREGYPLRPELIESAMYLYRATKDPYLLEIAVDILESIEHNAKTKCGYATVKDVRDHRLDNRMESFFLAETTKYLFLIFDEDNFIHNTGGRGTVINTPSGQCVIDAGGYVFNTEAHPVDAAALYCCSAERAQDLVDLQHLHDNVDLLALLDLTDPVEDIFKAPPAGPFLKHKARTKDWATMAQGPRRPGSEDEVDVNTSVRSVILESAPVAASSEPEANQGQDHRRQGTGINEVVDDLLVHATNLEELKEKLKQPRAKRKEFVIQTGVGESSPPGSSSLSSSTAETLTQEVKVKQSTTGRVASEREWEELEREGDGEVVVDAAVAGVVGKEAGEELEEEEDGKEEECRAREVDNYRQSLNTEEDDDIVDCSEFSDSDYAEGATTGGDLESRLFTCPAQPFHMRLSLMGELFMER